MYVDEHTKVLQKSYCKTVLAEHGQLTEELYGKINSENEATMRKVYMDQQNRIKECAEKIDNPTNKKITLHKLIAFKKYLMH